MQKIDRKKLLQALEYLGELLDENGLQCKICLYGGSAIILLNDFRRMTRDVDYRIIEISRKDLEQTTQKKLENIFIRLILETAEKMNFDFEWMNQAVKIFVSEKEKYSDMKSFANNALTVVTPTLECLLAMKCIALRKNNDILDIKNILNTIKIKTTKQILDIIYLFYPTRQLSLETIMKLDSICKELSYNNQPFSSCHP